MKISDININDLSPMMQQYAEIKSQHTDCILFFRLGEFYEMFFEDALIASQILEIALTGKNAGLEERVPMCGIPVHSYSTYLETLIQNGLKVAICEQLEEAGQSKLVKRGVTSIITPGSYISASSRDSNYIASIVEDLIEYHLCIIDLATGEVIRRKCIKDHNALLNILFSFNISEVVVEKFIDQFQSKGILQSLFYDKSEAYSHLCKDEVFYLLVNYLEQLQKTELIHLQHVNYYDSETYMKLDSSAKRNLELTKTLRNNQRQGSLLWFLDMTKTAMGHRMLTFWIENPLFDLNAILQRQDIVSLLMDEFIARQDISDSLKNVYDLERICAKLSLNTVNPKDLVWLKSSLQALNEIKYSLEKIDYPEELDDFTSLIHLLDNSLNEDVSMNISHGNIFKSNYSSELDELRAISLDGANFLLELEAEEKLRTGIKNLKIKYNKVFGYFIEISNSNLHLVKDEFGYIRKQTITSGERFITEQLKQKEELILSATEKTIKLETELFMQLKSIVVKEIVKIQKNARIIAQLDCLCAFSTVSEEFNLVKPIFSSDRIAIKDSKHPIIEKMFNLSFVANDIVFEPTQQIMLITGPNMSGKSTYMRQLALSAIMAQIGCFVSASTCEIPLFDAIYTRIGASDDISSGQSTFMVEMNEANNAIINATDHSLIIFDELGRGTSTYDGISISHSIITYLNQVSKVKVMFSTHYHELTSLANNDKIFNVSADVIEENDHIIFTHKIVNKPADKSYGIHVGKLAGLNQTIINNANEILKHYETSTSNSVVKEYVEVENPVVKELKNLDINSLTPLEALTILSEFKKKL